MLERVGERENLSSIVHHRQYGSTFVWGFAFRCRLGRGWKGARLLVVAKAGPNTEDLQKDGKRESRE